VPSAQALGEATFFCFFCFSCEQQLIYIYGHIHTHHKSTPIYQEPHLYITND
jgi:hypothetical protein